MDSDLQTIHSTSANLSAWTDKLKGLQLLLLNMYNQPRPTVSVWICTIKVITQRFFSHFLSL